MNFWSRTARISVCLTLIMMVMAILVEITPLGENPWMRVFFGVSALNFTLRATIPLVLGALSGILCERSGIINIGIEGMMLAGAFAGFVAKSSTNDWPLYASLLFSVFVALGDLSRPRPRSSEANPRRQFKRRLAVASDSCNNNNNNSFYYFIY